MTTPWLELFRTAIEKMEGPILLSLATVDGNGDPQVRSVVCRRVDADGGLWITSDARSAKNAELAAHPRAAASCWVREAGLQFRFAGDVEFERDAERVGAIWGALKAETRATFLWPEPGVARAPDERFPKGGVPVVAPESFSVLVMRPVRVEMLDVRPVPHVRRRWVYESGWGVVELNP
jgi:pyridoxamine 5'-phosphate oxidase